MFEHVKVTHVRYYKNVGKLPISIGILVAVVEEGYNRPIRNENDSIAAHVVIVCRIGHS